MKKLQNILSIILIMTLAGTISLPWKPFRILKKNNKTRLAEGLDSHIS